MSSMVAERPADGLKMHYHWPLPETDPDRKYSLCGMPVPPERRITEIAGDVTCLTCSSRIPMYIRVGFRKFRSKDQT